jgi:hypothetical protein
VPKPDWEEKRGFFAFRSGKRRRGSRLANRQPRGVSEGILEGPAPMMRPNPRNYMAGIPKILLSWTKQRSGGSQGNIFTERIIHAPRSQFLGLCESGPSTRIFPNRERERERERERARERATIHDPRGLTKGGPRKSTGGGQVMGAHWP